MGFRSDVYIKLPIKEQPVFTNLLLEYQYFDLAKCYIDNTYFYVLFSNIKWYTDTPGISAMLTYIETSKGSIVALHEDYTTDSYGNPDNVDLYPSVTVEGFNVTPTIGRFQQLHPELYI